MKINKFVNILTAAAVSISVMPFGVSANTAYADNAESDLKYTAIDGGLERTNGNSISEKLFYNRPLFGGYHGNDKGKVSNHIFTYAGDRPSIAFIQSIKLGNIFFGIKDGKWLHEMESITAKYVDGHEEYEITDQSFSGTIKVEFVRASEFDGILVKVQVPDELKDSVVVSMGGTSDGGTDYNSAILSKMNFVPSSCSGTTVEAEENYAAVYKTGTNTKLKCISSAPMTYSSKDASKFTSGVADVLESTSSQTPMAVGVTNNNTQNDIYFAFTAEDITDSRISSYTTSAPAKFSAAIEYVSDLSKTITIDTPDDYLDSMLATQIMSVEAAINYPYIMHGGTRWHVDHSGWRSTYAFSVLGDKENENDMWIRAFKENAQKFIESQQSMSDEIDFKGKIPSKVSLTNPVGGNNRYNMGEVFVDQLLYYYENTNDIDFMRKYGYQCVKDHLEFNDKYMKVTGTNLYENFLNAWNTDNKWANGGPSTIATTYAWNAYSIMAKLAEKLDYTEDAAAFAAKADAIKFEFKETLWSENRGVFAEYKDIFGNKLLHDAPDLSSIYTPIDLGLTDEFEAYQNLKYSENYIKRVPTPLNGELVYSSNWLPGFYSTMGIYPDEMINLALAYFQSGQVDEGYKVLNGFNALLYNNHGETSCAVLEDMVSSGNLAFTDVTSMAVKTVTDGIFGISIDAPNGSAVIKPAFPKDWNEAKIDAPNLSYSYKYKYQDNKEIFNVTNDNNYTCSFKVPVRTTSVKDVSVNGKSVKFDVAAGVGGAYVVFDAQNAPYVELSTTELNPNETVKATFNINGDIYDDAKCYFALYKNGVVQNVKMADVNLGTTKTELEISLPSDTTGCELKTFIWNGKMQPVTAPDEEGINAVISYDEGALPVLEYNTDVTNGGTLNISSSEGVITDIVDRQNVVLSKTADGKNIAEVTVNGSQGYHTIFANVNVDGVDMWMPVDFKINEPVSDVSDNKIDYLYAETISLDGKVNQRLESLHTNTYEFTYEGRDDYPLFPWSTDAMRTVMSNGRSWWEQQGKNSAPFTVDDTGLPEKTGIYNSSIGVPFRISVEDTKNAVFTSMYDNFDKKVTIPVNKTGQKMYFMLAVSTNNMQSRIENARITVNFKDGTNKVLSLSNPENIDDWLSYSKSPYAQSGTIEQLGSKAHANILSLNWGEDKEVTSIDFECVANEVLAGLLGATIYSFGDEQKLEEADALIADSELVSEFYNADKLTTLKDKTEQLKTLKSGEYTAKELIDAIKELSKAIDDYKNSSNVTISFDPESDVVNKGTEIAISSTNTKAEIRYTTDGSEPTKESELYESGENITVTTTMTIKAAAFYNGIQIGETVEKTYSVAGINLALNKNAEASNYHNNNPDYAGSKATDGDTSTRWATNNEFDSVWLTIDLENNVPFNKIVLNEALFDSVSRIGNIAIQYLADDGVSWRTAYFSTGDEKQTVTGTNPTKQSVREITFPAVTSSKVKLILGTVGTQKFGPTIFECEVYYDLSNTSKSDFAIGDYVTMGKYNDEDITWRVVDINENGPLLLSDKVLCMKSYDAKGTTGSHARGTGRDANGSDFWADSNMRSWLQSTASAGNVDWLCGNPPTKENVHSSSGIAYADEAGFLSDGNFTKEERDLIKTVKHKSIINPVDKDFVECTGLDTYNGFKTNWTDLIDGSKYNTALSYEVEDTMFVLDVKEYKDIYDKAMILGSTYAVGYNRADNNKNVFTWTRTPADSSTLPADADTLVINNVIAAQATWNNSGIKGNAGVRPAFYLNTDAASIADGVGTLSEPFTLSCVTQ